MPFGLGVLDASLLVCCDVDLRPAFLAIQNDVVYHCAAELLAPSTQIVDRIGTKYNAQ